MFQVLTHNPLHPAFLCVSLLLYTHSPYSAGLNEGVIVKSEVKPAALVPLVFTWTVNQSISMQKKKSSTVYHTASLKCDAVMEMK